MEAFQARWNPYVRLGRNDCRDHVQALVTLLTGRELRL